jgi:hypothetical protein
MEAVLHIATLSSLDRLCHRLESCRRHRTSHLLQKKMKEIKEEDKDDGKEIRRETLQCFLNCIDQFGIQAIGKHSHRRNSTTFRINKNILMKIKDKVR